MSGKNVVFYISTMFCEVGFSALIKVANPNCVCIGMMMKDVPKIQTTKVLLNSVGQIDTFFFWGTYWNEYLEELTEGRSSFVYCPSIVPLKELPNVQFISGETVTPLNMVKSYLQHVLGTGESLLNYYLKSHAEVIQMMADRLDNKNIVTNQPFFSGIAHMDKDESDFNAYVRHFSGDLSLKTILEKGTVIFEAEIQTARARVVRNARECTLQDGTSSCITTAGEFINLTHDALHKAFPNSLTSMVIDITLNPPPPSKNEAAKDESKPVESPPNLQPGQDVKVETSKDEQKSESNEQPSDAPKDTTTSFTTSDTSSEVLYIPVGEPLKELEAPKESEAPKTSIADGAAIDSLIKWSLRSWDTKEVNAGERARKVKGGDGGASAAGCSTKIHITVPF